MEGERGSGLGEQEIVEPVDGEPGLAASIPDGPWLDWAARLIPAVTIEAVIAWLDAGQPDPDHAAERIRQAVNGMIQAAQQSGS